ncbi:hypothetical protein ECTPHS_06887, partial [Ectothiorhodospira sp. PHS-1]
LGLIHHHLLETMTPWLYVDESNDFALENSPSPKALLS